MQTERKKDEKIGAYFFSSVHYYENDDWERDRDKDVVKIKAKKRIGNVWKGKVDSWFIGVLIKLFIRQRFLSCRCLKSESKTYVCFVCTWGVCESWQKRENSHIRHYTTHTKPKSRSYWNLTFTHMLKPFFVFSSHLFRWVYVAERFFFHFAVVFAQD